ncbi:alpha-E domain-containing protein [Polaribacter sargassicola]|uniref:alpha-E domain-containing protein n=1 Tax=Polaribacter sargassicola TaxID=2836891 RepID=UPI001F1A006E|nr:alpha-E domain-containing protein [Polaribacter sp. DS7-9]MCG1036832.1 alpha-E domain-containing protein [Polaribacter sp. DS7-9]
MLARVANNLFWMGRYLERSEHIARYLNVNYFSSLDAPSELAQSRDFVLRSMLFVADEEELKLNKPLNERDVLYDIGLNPDKFYSIYSSIGFAQQNANGARDLISTELYESINTLNRTVKNYSAERFVKNGLFEFTNLIKSNIASLRTKIRATLLHDEVYAIIMLGVYIERANQVIRIINSKYNDALIEHVNFQTPVKTSYEWTTLLKCVETYDMMRGYYRKAPSSYNVLEFLILNPHCPRSIMNSLNSINYYMSFLTKEERPHKDSAAFLVGKLMYEYRYKCIEDFQEDLKGFIENLVDDLSLVGEKMDSDYFSLY